MKVSIHHHAASRIIERGATENEIVETVTNGERFPAKFGRTGFRRNFPFSGLWRNRQFRTKQVEAFAVIENDEWLVITVIVKYF